jgi:hypothetical protein
MNLPIGLLYSKLAAAQEYDEVTEPLAESHPFLTAGAQAVGGAVGGLGGMLLAGNYIGSSNARQHNANNDPRLAVAGLVGAGVAGAGIGSGTSLALLNRFLTKRTKRKAMPPDQVWAPARLNSFGMPSKQ